MSQELTINPVAEIDKKIIEQVLVTGDLSKLSPEQRCSYYLSTCQSLGLNPTTRPFEYVTFQGKMVLYARKEATEQLRKIHRISLEIKSTRRDGDLYIVSTRATMPDGRFDESTGVVTLGNAKGDVLANLLMKAESKAKRRATLSICGLGMLDETEIESIPNAKIVDETYVPPAQASEEKPFSLENEDAVKRLKAWLLTKGVSNEALEPLIERLVGAKRSEMPEIIKKFQTEAEPFSENGT